MSQTVKGLIITAAVFGVGYYFGKKSASKGR